MKFTQRSIPYCFHTTLRWNSDQQMFIKLQVSLLTLITTVSTRNRSRRDKECYIRCVNFMRCLRGFRPMGSNANPRKWPIEIKQVVICPGFRSMIFSNFWLRPVNENLSTEQGWKERIKKSVKLTSLKVICCRLTKIQLRKVAEFYRRLYGGRHVRANLPLPSPHPTPPYKRL